MKILKKVLLIILAIIVALLIIAAIMPKTLQITTSTTIEAPRQEVWDYVSKIRNQENYSVRVMADPDLEIMYSGTDGTVGFSSSRDSDMKNVGKGEQEIIAIDPGNSFEVEVRFEKPMQATDYATTTLTDSGTDTIVTTTFEGKTPWPMNIMCIFMKSMLRKDMDENLSNLKTILEQE